MRTITRPLASLSGRQEEREAIQGQAQMDSVDSGSGDLILTTLREDGWLAGNGLKGRMECGMECGMWGVSFGESS